MRFLRSGTKRAAAAVLPAILCIVVCGLASGAREELKEPTPQTRVYVNDISGVFPSSDRAYFDPKNTYEKELTAEEVIEYLGRDVRPEYIPHGMIDYLEENPEYRYTVIMKNDGGIAFDRVYFSYAESFGDTDYSPSLKRLNIAVSKLGAARDCVYVWPEDMRSSEICGIDVLIGERKMPYGPFEVVEEGENIPAGYYDLFVAEFELGDITLEVVADNFTEDEFVRTLSSIIDC